MVTQTPAFFPVLAANGAGNGAVPMMGNGTPPQGTPFANALTQAQTQTQAGMNPLLLAMLNGLMGMPAASGNLPLIPNTAEGTTADTPAATTETAPTAQEAATPENANLVLLAMSALCINPAQTATPQTDSQMPTQANGTAAQTQSASAVAMEQAIPQDNAELAALLAKQMSAGQVPVSTAPTLPTEQNPLKGNASQNPTQAMTIVSESIQAKQPLAQPVSNPAVQDVTRTQAQPVALPPTQAVSNTAAQVKTGANSEAVQGQANESALAVSATPTSRTTLEQSVEAQTLTTVGAEPLTITQGVTKKVAALPMDTERAIALPTLALVQTAERFSSETETSEEKHDETAEQAVTKAEVKPHEKPDTSHETLSFGQTLHRTESAGQSSALQTDAVKPQTADRYDVAAQVTKHLETMTAAGGRSELVLQLKPEHLGQVKITLSTSETGMTAKITMDSTQAHQAINGAKESLRSAFEQRGINLETLDVSLNQQAFGNGQQAFAGMQMGNPYSQTHGTRFHNATQMAFDSEEEGEMPAIAAMQNQPNGLNRLDFRA